MRYRFKTRRLVEHLLYTGEVDWVNSLFLSCRFSAARIGQYNEFVYSFFKCLSQERLQYAEGWYDEHERAVEAEDIQVGDWLVQRRCPHLKADLSRFGVLDGDTLTCAHGRVRPSTGGARPVSATDPGRRSRATAGDPPCADPPHRLSGGGVATLTGADVIPAFGIPGRIDVGWQSYPSMWTAVEIL